MIGELNLLQLSQTERYINFFHQTTRSRLKKTLKYLKNISSIVTIIYDCTQNNFFPDI